MAELSNELLQAIACPLCKSGLRYEIEHSKLVCKNPRCNKDYPVEDGMPIMLVEV